MKKYCSYFAFTLSVLVLATACQNKNTPSTDPKENRYYRDYMEIYESCGTVSRDTTQQKLAAYLQEFPENAEAQMLAGNIFYSSADYEKAIAHYKTAIHLQPQRAIFYSALGTVYNVQNEIDSAEKYLMQAIALNDSSANTFLNASFVCQKKNEKEKSFAFADSAFAKGNSSPIICSGLSFVFYKWNEQQKSQERFEQAVSLGLKDTSEFKEVLNGKIKLEDYYRTNY